ncbi:MAG: ADP-glyceromanno-heptose 6-epimerase [Omnitrophica bacterium RBG_13_46_9]|nr:MAG: ADP-glyceromanno-heptose 6-epimerase [Omnitrophica bacterium RBG_13_46_9]
MKVLLTGGAGFIGSCMLWRLNEGGITDVTVVDHLGLSGKWKNLVGKHFKEYFEKEKFLDYLENGSLNRKIDTVIHFGACSSTTEQNASYMMENNYIYSRRLAVWALRNKKKFLYASSGATYGAGEMGYSDRDEVTLKVKPLNIYGYSKHLFDLWVIKNKLQKEFVGLKFFNVFGPNEGHKGDMRSMVNKGYQQIKSTGGMSLFKSYEPDYRDGEQKRDFVYVKDAVELVWYFLKHPDKGGIFNIGSGRAQTWNELAYALFSALGMKANINYIDMPEVLKGKYQYFTQAELGKLKKTGCRHKFFDLSEAVKDYVSYLENETYM